jgi:hypothetical protein
MKAILVVAGISALSLGILHVGSDAWARGGGGGHGGHGGHGGMVSGWRGSGSHGMHGMHGMHGRFASGGRHGHDDHAMNRHGMKDRGRFAQQGMWHKVPQRNNNFQGQWQVSGGGGGGSVGDICLYSVGCQGIWQAVPQTQSAPQSRGFQRSWHAGEEL